MEGHRVSIRAVDGKWQAHCECSRVSEVVGPWSTMAEGAHIVHLKQVESAESSKE